MERLNLDKVKLMAAAATLAMFAGTACAHMEIYGHVNKGFLWTDDGYEDSSIFVDNDYAPSLVGFRASKHLDNCWTFGGVTELQFNSNNTRLVSQVEHENGYNRIVFVRKLDSWMSYGQWGTLNLGLGESASWGITNLSYAGTTETSLGSSVADMAGGMRFRVNGSRATAANPSVERVFDALNGVGDTYDGLFTTENRVMYKTGDWMGLNLGISYGNVVYDVNGNSELIDNNTRNNRQYFDAALRYAHDFCDFKLSAGVAYAHYTRSGQIVELDPGVGVATNHVNTWSGSIAAEHKPTLINVAFATGVKDKLNTHISENQAENEDVINRHGKTPTKVLNDAKALDNAVFAHAVKLTDDDRKIIKENNVSLSHCPGSNLKLASGAFEWVKAKEKGINVSLGTDGCSSSNDLDMWNVMRSAANLARLITEDAAAIPVAEVVRAATYGGAVAIGMQDRIGTVEVGKDADLIVLDLDQPHLVPVGDPHGLLVYAAGRSDVVHVLVAGDPVIVDRISTKVDMNQVISEARIHSAK